MASAVRDPPLPQTGLTEAEAAARAPGRAQVAPASSRSYGSIVVANVFTVFNAILLTFGALTLAFGDPRDALFLGIVVANAAIGIVQEARAKRALDRLSALVAPTASAVRDGRVRPLAPEALVVGDLVRLAPGDQVVADGTLTQTAGLRLDESVLTGESAAVAREPGDGVRSGAFVAEGTGAMVVRALGEDSYAQRLAGEARAFRHPRSPLERSLNRLLMVLVAVMVPLGLALAASLVLRDTPLREAVPKATAAMTSLVPEGLVLLASLTFAVAAARMARRGALAQQLNAIESLASVDVVCTDKTGTLTDSALTVSGVVPAPGVAAAELERALACAGASATARNLTLEAIARRFPGEREPLREEVPFSSRRRWSGVAAGGEGYVLGAPELLVRGALAERAAQESAAGRRVIAAAAVAPEALRGEPGDAPPAGARPLGLVMLAERLRPATRETVAFLRREGVELLVLSGDAPATVAAIAADAGLPLAGPPLDGRALPEDDAALLRALRAAPVVGRIAPEGKRRVVEALRDAGRYVAMIGDGVNDVPALKASRLAIAQGSGAQMAKSVADVVLVSGDFATLPQMVAEGRRILRNVQRVAKVFVTKTAFAAFLVVTVGMTARAYPFLPRHLTIASTLGVGIPAFFLALAPSSGPWRSGTFLRDVASFAVPAGVATGAAVLAAYLGADHLLGADVLHARTVSTTVLLGALLLITVHLESATARRRRAVEALAGVMAAGYAGVLALAPARRFFSLAAPDLAVAVASAAGLALAMVLIAAGLRLSARAPARRPAPAPGRRSAAGPPSAPRR